MADRYHSQVLRTPSEVRHTVHYIRDNRRKHTTQPGDIIDPAWIDPYCSHAADAIVLPRARTWLALRALARERSTLGTFSLQRDAGE